MKTSMRAMELFEVLKAFRAEKGYSPSYVELGKIMGVSGVMIFKWISELRRADLVKLISKKGLQIGNEIPYSAKLLEIMRIIVKNPAVTMTAIAAQLQVSKPTVFEHIQRLKELGAIAEEKDVFKVLDKSLG